MGWPLPSRRGPAGRQIAQLALTFLGLPAIVPKLLLSVREPFSLLPLSVGAAGVEQGRYSIARKSEQARTETRRCQGAEQTSPCC